MNGVSYPSSNYKLEDTSSDLHSEISISYAMVCPPAREDNPWALN